MSGFGSSDASSFGSSDASSLGSSDASASVLLVRQPQCYVRALLVITVIGSVWPWPYIYWSWVYTGWVPSLYMPVGVPVPMLAMPGTVHQLADEYALAD